MYNRMWRESTLKVCGGNWSSNASDCELDTYKAASNFNLKLNLNELVMTHVTLRLAYLRNCKNCKIIE